MRSYLPGGDLYRGSPSLGMSVVSQEFVVLDGMRVSHLFYFTGSDSL